MQTIGLALRSKGEEGEPLPSIFPQLKMEGLLFRRGWLHLIAGAAGGGKSALASFMAIHSRYPTGRKVPALYFSADNDKLTFGCAAVASSKKIHVNAAEKLLEQDDPDTYAYLDEVTGHLWVTFEPSPSPRDIRMEMEAFATVYGDWPHLVVVDNLMDVDGSGGGFIDERTTQDGILDFLKRLGRETGAAILVLCHVTAAHSNGTDPISRDGLMNKIEKRPQVVLTLHQPKPMTLGVSIVKNRRGRAMTDGSLVAELPWSPEYANFLGR